MNPLLELALTAHGGLDRWNRINSINLKTSITGGIWYIKGRPDVLKNVAVEVATKTEKVAMTFPGQDKSTVFESRLITIGKGNGSAVERYENPRATFAGQTLQTPWEDVHVAYFSGEALWTYLNTPFLYTWPGFVTEEIEPWQEKGETWRRLKVTFPDSVTSHTREQISFFGPDGLLRRHDYTVDILGGATGANYATDYRDIGGIIIPATRRIYAYEGDHVPVKSTVLVAIDMGEIAVALNEKV